MAEVAPFSGDFSAYRYMGKCCVNSARDDILGLISSEKTKSLPWSSGSTLKERMSLNMEDMSVSFDPVPICKGKSKIAGGIKD